MNIYLLVKLSNVYVSFIYLSLIIISTIIYIKKKDRCSAFVLLLSSILFLNDYRTYIFDYNLKLKYIFNIVNNISITVLLVRFIYFLNYSKNKVYREEIECRDEKIKEQKEAMKENDTLIGQIFEYSPIGKAVISISGEWLKVNTALCNITGYTREELLNITFQSLTHPEEVQEDIILVEKLLNREIEYYEIEKRYIRKNGSIINVLLNAFIIWDEKDDTPKYFVVQIQDIDKRVNLEEANKKIIEELKKVSEDKDDFVNTVSHELRTPLTNMKMAVSMLNLYKTKDTPVVVTKYLSILEQECYKEIEIINDLLDMQRLSSDYIEKEQQELINISELIESISISFKDRAIEQDIKLKLNIQPDIKLKVNVNYFNRVINELINNACKYTESTGIIVVELSENHKEILIEVKNTGVLTTSEIENIFKKFYRLPNTSRQVSGTGLGIPLVEKLVSTFSGNFSVYCEDDLIIFKISISKIIE